jgi:hypothetical protein
VIRGVDGREMLPPRPPALNQVQTVELETLFIPPVTDLDEVQRDRGVRLPCFDKGADLSCRGRPEHVVTPLADVVNELGHQLFRAVGSSREPYSILGAHYCFEACFLNRCELHKSF